MKKILNFFLWVTGIFVVVVIVGGILGLIARRVPPNTVLTLRIEGNIPEQPPREPLTHLFTGLQTTVTDIVQAVDRARSDPRITGIEVHVAESTMNFAKMQEIRDKIRQFNRSGKFSVAYVEFATNGPYYVASACQTLILLPKSMLYVRGMMASATFFRGALDKLGIYPDLYHIGDYKSAMNIFTAKSFTPAHREATQALLGDWYSEFLRGVAEARGMKGEEVADLIQKGPFSSEEALAARLVDRIAYADEVRDFIKQKNRGSESHLGVREYLKRTERRGRSTLAIIYGTGMILPGQSSDNVMGSDTIAEQFRRARDNQSVKAVILRVDSPGGTAFASEVIRHEVEITQHVKPVVVSMSDVAASGGYWISMSAKRIVAEPGTITGSIGVVSGKFNLSGLYAKLGLTKDYVKTTENATLDYPFENYTPAQRDRVQKYMRDIYKHFVQGVADGRHMRVDAVEKIGQGRVWTGERARQLGLVDELGGLDRAISVAKDLARIPQSEQVSLMLLPPPKSLFDQILGLMSGSRTLEAALSPRVWLSRVESVTREPVWAILPGVPQVQ